LAVLFTKQLISEHTISSSKKKEHKEMSNMASKKKPTKKPAKAPAKAPKKAPAKKKK
jgi:hypothetical protein